MKSYNKETLKIYWRKVMDRKWSFWGIAIFAFLSSVCGVISPLYYKKFFDIISSNFTGSIMPVIWVLVSLAAISMLRFIFRRLGWLIQNPFHRRSVSELYEIAFAKIHKHSFSYFNNNFSGSFSRKIGGFTNAFEKILNEAIWSFVPLIVVLTGALIVFFSVNSKLAIGMIIWTAIFLMINILFSRYRIKFDLERNKAKTEVGGLFADTIVNQSNIKLFNGYTREVKGYSAALLKVEKIWGKVWNISWTFQTLQEFLAVVLEVGVFFYAIFLWQKGQFTVGDFVMVQSYLMAVMGNIWGFGDIIRNLYESLSEASEMTEILLMPYEIQDIPNAKKLIVEKGKIEFKNVNFNYSDSGKILDNFALLISPKEKTAFIGPSGAGKSTIVKVLLRTSDITSGEVLIDGQNIAKVTQESLWQHISYVPQDPMLFHRSLMENIRYGKPEATDAEVIKAAKSAYCHEFIQKTKDGYQSLVGERGIKLSGGERQRVAIARAILRNAPILILDEATSSLDSESEAMIQEALKNLMHNKTVIIIAHRLSTIKESDRIIVIKDGQVFEEGTHETLLKKKTGLYKQLWTRQVGGFIS